MQEIFGAQPQVLLKLDTGPDSHVTDSERSSSFGNLCSAGVRNRPAAHKLEGIQLRGRGLDRLLHIGLGLFQCQRAVVHALDGGPLRRSIIERFRTGNVPPLIAPSLAVPN